MRLLIIALALVFTTGPVAQEPPAQPEQPRFRAGANLVRLDAYVSLNGQSLADLKPEDFEVLEDGVPQKIESFQFMRPRPPVSQAARVEPNTIAESRLLAAESDARLFVLFLDIRHVHLEGSYRAKNPLINLLDRVIGQDDLVGLMTPDMSARNLTLARRTTSIEGFLRNTWFWGERQQLNPSDPREQELQMCYPDGPNETRGLAQELIDRRRERATLDSIEDLIIHLEGLREERKFVILMSEGWRLPPRDDNLTRVVRGNIPGGEPIGVTPVGRLTTSGQYGGGNREWCERERMRLAAEDLEQDFRTLLQRANRANVSFYTVDPRGLVVFDEDLSLRRATDITGDRARLNSRQTSLRELAENTDGIAVLNTNNIDAAMQRMLADIDSYYLLGYYSTNTKLDGRFRKLTVRIKRAGATVRARPGYLAPTEAEMASARVDRLMSGAAPGHSDTPPELRRALESLTPGRGIVPVRVQTAAGPGQIWMTGEIDAATLKGEEWQQGGRARLSFEHERGAAAAIEKEITLEPGQRTFSAHEGAALPPGRYVIRVSLFPKGSSLPLQTTVDVVVPQAEALMAANGRVLRRGPATGLEYHSTADARFRRTERIRFEVAKLAADGTVTARLVNRAGQTMPLSVAVSERADQSSPLRLIVADLILAPLAQGEYVMEVAIEKDGKKELAVFGFRIVP